MVLFKRKFVIVCHEKVVRIPLEGDEILQVHGERTQGVVKTLMNTKVEFRIDLVHGAISVAKSPYRLAPLEMQELSEQLRELQGKDNSKEWNSGEDQLKLRWTIYLMVLADAAESVSDTIGFEYCLASSSGWTKSSNCGDETSQKDYADSSRKPLEFEVGNRELLKVTPWKGVVRKISGHEVKSGLNVENGGSYGPFGLKEEVLGFQAKCDQLEWVLWYAPWLSDQLEWICGMLHGLVINWSSSAIETSRNRVNGECRDDKKDIKKSG
ncbi:hypothetical protein Tco_1485010 [Tanacetum coccineum]